MLMAGCTSQLNCTDFVPKSHIQFVALGDSSFGVLYLRYINKVQVSKGIGGILLYHTAIAEW